MYPCREGGIYLFVVGSRSLYVCFWRTLGGRRGEGVEEKRMMFYRERKKHCHYIRFVTRFERQVCLLLHPNRRTLEQ